MTQSDTSETVIRPIVPMHLIQSVRLCHALMESRFRVSISSADSRKFSLLKTKFGAQYKVDVPNAVMLDSLTVSHKEPVTAVGTVERPLVFPHAIVRHCHSLWPTIRDIPISFSGLVSHSRSALIRDWCETNFPDSQRFPSREPFLHRLNNKVRKICGLAPAVFSMQIGEVELWSSARGRKFPIKSWDEKYWEMLSRSRFVLCPSGDCIWSYRFFESILCGAMPIVETPCEAYEGFVYKTMDEPYVDTKWNREVAEHNFNLCFERITVPHDIMNEELESLLKM